MIIIPESSVFYGKEFDMLAFANYPKCKANWMDSRGSGCLFTAFLCGGFGLPAKTVLSINGNTGNYQLRPEIEEEVLNLIGLVFPEQSKDKKAAYLMFRNETSLFQFRYMYGLIRHYDRDKPEVALKMIWKIIEALPKKKNFVQKSQVIMPEVLVCPQ